MYVLRDTVAVKWDEKAQILQVLCLWKGGASDDPSKSTYQELEEVQEFHEGRCKFFQTYFVVIHFLTILCTLPTLTEQWERLMQ